jgi:hypothetical protein
MSMRCGKWNCTREALDGDVYCILHSSNINKYRGTFSEAWEALLAGPVEEDGELLVEGVIFPGPLTIDSGSTALEFRGCRFLGPVTIQNVRQRWLQFNDTTFCGEFLVSGALLKGNFHLRNCIFEESCQIQNTHFKGEIYLSGNKLFKKISIEKTKIDQNIYLTTSTIQGQKAHYECSLKEKNFLDYLETVQEHGHPVEAGEGCRYGACTRAQLVGHAYCILHASQKGKNPAAFREAWAPLEKEIREEGGKVEGIIFPPRHGFQGEFPKDLDFEDCVFQDVEFKEVLFEKHTRWSCSTVLGALALTQATGTGFWHILESRFDGPVTLAQCTFKRWSIDLSVVETLDLQDTTFTKGFHISRSRTNKVTCQEATFKEVKIHRSNLSILSLHQVEVREDVRISDISKMEEIQIQGGKFQNLSISNLGVHRLTITDTGLPYGSFSDLSMGSARIEAVFGDLHLRQSQVQGNATLALKVQSYTEVTSVTVGGDLEIRGKFEGRSANFVDMHCGTLTFQEVAFDTKVSFSDVQCQGGWSWQDTTFQTTPYVSGAPGFELDAPGIEIKEKNVVLKLKT